MCGRTESTRERLSQEWVASRRTGEDREGGTLPTRTRLEAALKLPVTSECGGGQWKPLCDYRLILKPD